MSALSVLAQSCSSKIYATIPLLCCDCSGSCSELTCCSTAILGLTVQMHAAKNQHIVSVFSSPCSGGHVPAGPCSDVWMENNQAGLDGGAMHIENVPDANKCCS